MQKQQGFTLFEVLISMFIAGVAVLGLVLLELNILRSSQSSFNYTVATIEANTLVDKVWRNLCQINGTATPDAARYGVVFTDWRDTLINNGLTGANSSGVPTDFELQDKITVSWTEKNFEAVEENDRVILNVNYPDFTGACL